MGKVRVKTIGVEEIEDKQKEKAKVKKEQKQARKTAKGAHGGERVVSMAPTEEELLAITQAQKLSVSGESSKSKIKRLPRVRSRRYRETLTLVGKNKTYPLSEALELLRRVSLAKFDGTVELHINVAEKGLSGQLILPHGSGKKTRVKIASDQVVEDIQNGRIDFDILLSSPSMMPKLAKVARVLGPRGLMPNPKNGTISQDPEKLAKKFEAGQTYFRTESQAPIIHLSVGKVSMKDSELAENIQSVFSAIDAGKIKNVTLKSTISPGIKISIS